MDDSTKIKYTFYNETGETVVMTFTILQVEGMQGGFMKCVQGALHDIEFGKIDKVERMMEVLE